jgi:hypothetical protein
MHQNYAPKKRNRFKGLIGAKYVISATRRFVDFCGMPATAALAATV